MITAWDVYWVMQLDRIGGATFALSVIVAVVGWIFAIGRYLHINDEIHGDDRARAFARHARYVRAICATSVALLLAATLLPSSKTAAAMIVLPAITSDTVVETVGPEARELYELAKDALRSVAKPKEGEAK